MIACCIGTIDTRVFDFLMNPIQTPPKIIISPNQTAAGDIQTPKEIVWTRIISRYLLATSILLHCAIGARMTADSLSLLPSGSIGFLGAVGARSFMQIFLLARHHDSFLVQLQLPPWWVTGNDSPASHLQEKMARRVHQHGSSSRVCLRWQVALFPFGLYMSDTTSRPR